MAHYIADVAPSLSHDILHVYILPHILSEHLHNLLLSPEAPSWHAFYTLPLVSCAFRDSCQALYTNIFGLESNENGSVIDEILTYTQHLWNQAKIPRPLSLQLPECTYQELMSGNSLIRVYVCTALARSFLSTDILRPIALQGRIHSLCEDLYGIREEYGGGYWEMSDRAEDRPDLRLRDDTMHRVYLPLTCAVSLCDSVRPESLSYIVAEYLAEIVPTYSTAPVLMKYAQDLESYTSRIHRVDAETWTIWTHQTLGLIETTSQLLKRVQGKGKLVQSFSTVSTIPLEVLEATNIIDAVRNVGYASWGADTTEIRERANSLLRQWGVTR